MNCPFCQIKNFVEETENLFAIEDRFPVTKMHHLIIPKNHRKDFFELNASENSELPKLLAKLKNKIIAADPSVTGFNIGMNCGESAGQTVFHCHVHLIPRRDGDMNDPKGGVRGVIPTKQKY